MVRDLWVVFSIRVPFGVLFIRVLYSVGEPPKRGPPNLRELPFCGFWENVVIPWPTGSRARGFVEGFQKPCTWRKNCEGLYEGLRLSGCWGKLGGLSVFGFDAWV